MSNLISIIKSIRVKQILTVLLAGCLLTISTACSQNPTAQIDGGKDVVERQTADNYDNYDAKQGYKGGMNGYDDDLRYDARDAAKAKGLVDTARSRQKDNLGDYSKSIVDRAGNKLESAGEEIPSQLKAQQEKALDYIQDKSENLQDNLERVPEGAKSVFNEAANNAKGAIKDLNRSTSETAKEIKGNFQDLT